jgi:uncharacterized membrane protein
MLWSAAACAGMDMSYFIRRRSAISSEAAPSLFVALPAVIAIKFLTLDTLIFRLGHAAVSQPTVLFNLQTLAALFVTGALLLSWHMSRQDRDEPKRTRTRIFAFGVVLVLLWAGSFEIDRAAVWLTSAGALAARESVVRQVGLSIFWSIYAVGCVALGFRARVAALRYFGLALFAVTLLKVVLVDLAQVATGFRVLSFMGLGLLLLGTSVLYGKLSPKLLKS